VKTSWRQPRGTDNKVRLKLKGYQPQPGSGYRNPRALRGKHPSGYNEVRVHNTDELEALDPDTQAARIAKAVGLRKALLIQDKADELGIIILNPKRSLEEEILEEIEEEKSK
jgi:large subunit ribosomal protein L32e